MKPGVMILVIAVVCICQPSTAAASETRRFVLIVGSNRAPADTMTPLVYADDDAAKNYELFSGIADEIVLLTILDTATQKQFPGLAPKSRPPTAKHLMAALNRLYDTIRKTQHNGTETELYFIYSGHGRILPGQEGAVTLEDGELTRTDLYEMILKKSPATFNHLIIDACNSYFLVNAKGDDDHWKDDRSGRQRTEVNNFFHTQDLDEYPNTGVVLSTSSEAETHEWERYQGGVFSHEVRSGLLGPADVTNDGVIEYSELAAFVRAANYRVADKKAKLHVFVRPPKQDANRPIFDLLALKDAFYLTIPKETSGLFYMEDSRGLRMMDFHKVGGYLMTVAMSASRVHYLHDRQGNQAFTIDPDKQHVNLAMLHPQKRASSSRGSVERSFQTQLFLQPFSPDFYAGLIEATGDVPGLQIERPEWQHAAPEKTADKIFPWKPLGITSAALSVGAFGSGVLFTVLASKNARLYREAVNREDSYLQNRNLYTGLSIASYTIGALFAGFSIYSVLKYKGHTDKKHTVKKHTVRKSVAFVPSAAATKEGGMFGLMGWF